ncbi:MAG: biopolymer transporter ExbD [Nisaea sp.]|jgi:biopolymer transport protein ExbD|uniref:ExbD/TolR family protein n=1 Tax=Nisaea sp. TaxID=2024842 RepID=UPI001B27FBF0|nr:biopolymer transporter ExbD [Nisaea sp.]MBO6560980.1 biopolymer transporter ExbD [Nisaea sp.]
MRLAARRRRPTAEISLTPLIDVVFILLVFFMLASSFLDWRSIGLQTAKLGGAGSASEGSVLVKLKADGGFLVSGENMDHAGFTERLAKLAGRETKPKIVLEAERGVPLQAVVDTVDQAAAQGLTEVTLASRPER